MKANKAVYIIGAAVCSTLSVVSNLALLPVALVYDAFESLANISDKAVDKLIGNVKGEE